MATPGYYHNANARTYQYQDRSDLSPMILHTQLPHFEQTPLTRMPKSNSGFNHVFIKDESERLGLPSFKILGASWGTFRSIVQWCGLSLDSDLRTVQKAAQSHKLHLVTATDGNHGRAIAFMARLLGIESTIFVPGTVNEYTRNSIRKEGATVTVELKDYDAAVMTAYHYSKASPNYLCVQDTSFDGYHEIPTWIVQGYSTMFNEVEAQLETLGLKATHIITPVGVGSLANAVVAHCKSGGRSIAVVAVESEVAACLQHSLQSGHITTISTKSTIMDGINCGTVSDISWPALKDGIDGAITISDYESHEAVLNLKKVGVKAGPCGASTTAALQKLGNMPNACSDLGLNDDSVIVLLNTEGPREYTIPNQVI